MLEVVLWVIFGFVVLSVLLLSLAVIIGYVLQLAGHQHIDDWSEHD
jgi:hypothetical protein